MFHVDVRRDRRTDRHDETNGRVSQLLRTPLKFYIPSTDKMYVFSTDVKTNSSFFSYTALIGCLLRGTG